jgi:hypothetical protein
MNFSMRSRNPNWRLLIAGTACFFLDACARSWVNYPPQIAIDGNGRQHVVSARAAEFNGSDLEGGTTIDVTNNGVHVAATDGINNSRSTFEGYRTARFGAAAIGWTVGVLGLAHSAASAAQAVNSSNNAANVANARTAAGVANARIGAGVQSQAIKAGVATEGIKAGVQSQAISSGQAVTTEAIRAGVTTIPR